jgi:hypothetical protein
MRMPQPPGDPVTDDNDSFTAEERATIHRMAHQVDELWKLAERLAPFLPVLEAYGRGGKIAASTALRRVKRL